MRKLILIPIFVVLLSLFSFAAMDSTGPFCEHQGYAVDEGNRLCILDDGNSCDIMDFFNGDCGVEYLKEFPCVEEGEFVFHFEECCEGLMSHIKGGAFGQPRCQPDTLGNRITAINFYPLFYLIIPVVVIYLNWKKWFI